MSVLKLKLLGQMECATATQPLLALSTRKSEVLLAYLALAPGIRHPRERLINLLWSDRAEEQARNSLRQSLSSIKKSLEATTPLLLEVERTTVRVDPDLVQVDALEFEQLAANDDIDNLTRAAALYQGEFLEGITIRDAASQEWLANERERYRRIVVEVLSSLSQLQLSTGEHKAAIGRHQPWFPESQLRQATRACEKYVEDRQGRWDSNLRSRSIRQLAQPFPGGLSPGRPNPTTEPI